MDEEDGRVERRSRHGCCALLRASQAFVSGTSSLMAPLPLLPTWARNYCTITAHRVFDRMPQQGRKGR
jgi:hypothetical protein